MLLEVKGLAKNFGGLKAINDLEFSVRKGEILGIIGPNGAGKSTLFNLLTGELEPSAGEIIFEEIPVTGLPTYKLALLGIARTYQTTRIFLSGTVFDNIMVGLIARTSHGALAALGGRSRRKAIDTQLIDRYREVVRYIRLEEKSDTVAGELGQEEQKRLAIGLALASDPKLLLLDEPTGGINIEEINLLMSIIREISQRGIAICLIEHKMKMVMELCERLIVLNYGVKIAEGTPSEVRGNQAAIKAYLGDEYAA
jgi:branched-chain amino acid transport system ATP-binding protein